MADISGLQQVVNALRERAAKARRDHHDVSVVVGFSAGYAIYVHENLEAFHKVGSAKFLEQPYRELSNDGTLGEIVTKSAQRGQTLAQGLVLAGLRLQREAQLLCPVLTGNLKASAFTRLESAAESV